MNIMVTGANGFIGKNLCVRIAEIDNTHIIPITRESTSDEIKTGIAQADFIFHLAGVNRPEDDSEFHTGNALNTKNLCDELTSQQLKTPIVYTSSTQAENDNPYGDSKREAEEYLKNYGSESGADVSIYRLPNVFGKWCKPNYNSAVATFCHNIARDIPIVVNDESSPLSLVYIDDVITAFLSHLDSGISGEQNVSPVYTTTVGDVARSIRGFKESRTTLVTDRVGTGLLRALYSTYVSYLPTESFSYQVPQHKDDRGVFVEMLKTPDAGQFSFFTAHPGITRGDHYHHSKTEKFLVIRGKAHFGFRHISTGEVFELTTDGEVAEIVETVPGWTHNITNVGDEEMVVMIWANEIFDPAHPDTIPQKV